MKFEWIIPKILDGKTCLKALGLLLPEYPNRFFSDAFKNRDVKLDEVRISADKCVRYRQILCIYLPKPPELDTPWQDDDYLILNKPQGMPSVDSELGSSETACFHTIGQHFWACHRLDVQTGGLLLMAKNIHAREKAIEWFAAHQIEKRYRCLTIGCPDNSQGVLRAYLLKDKDRSTVSICRNAVAGAVPVVTAYQVISPGEIARLEIEPITGRTHQIRAHLASEGYPVLGDDKYGNRAVNHREHYRKQCLWSVEIRLPDGRGTRIDEPF